MFQKTSHCIYLQNRVQKLGRRSTVADGIIKNEKQQVGSVKVFAHKVPTPLINSFDLVVFQIRKMLKTFK